MSDRLESSPTERPTIRAWNLTGRAIHRVIEIKGDKVFTQGDNAPNRDEGHRTAKDIEGVPRGLPMNQAPTDQTTKRQRILHCFEYISVFIAAYISVLAITFLLLLICIPIFQRLFWNSFP